MYCKQQQKKHLVHDCAQVLESDNLAVNVSGASFVLTAVLVLLNCSLGLPTFNRL